MILIGLGANIAGPWGPPRATVLHAITLLDRYPCKVLRASRLIATPPFGRTDQPGFINAVVSIATLLPPRALMRHLHAIEHAAGRRRFQVWGPRTLDLDLLDYHGRVIAGGVLLAGSKRTFELPHPGVAERAFVLGPIAEIAPNWRHPATGSSASELLLSLQ